MSRRLLEIDPRGVSPYLLAPLRSLDQVLRERASAQISAGRRDAEDAADRTRSRGHASVPNQKSVASNGKHRTSF